MRFSINLRGDLTKLSDSALAERHEKFSQALDTAVNEPRWKNTELTCSFRGPVRHPWAYPILSVVGYWGGGGGYVGPAYGLLIMNKIVGRSLPSADAMDMHLLRCELRDLQDEMQRRLSQRCTGRS